MLMHEGAQKGNSYSAWRSGIWRGHTEGFGAAVDLMKKQAVIRYHLVKLVRETVSAFNIGTNRRRKLFGLPFFMI